LKCGIRVAATFIAAWMLLTVPPEDARFVGAAAMGWMDFPKTVEVSNLGASPVLARIVRAARWRRRHPFVAFRQHESVLL